MTSSKRNTRDFTELKRIARQVAKFQKRVTILATRIKGEDMDQITAALERLSRAADALIAKGQGAITPAQAGQIASTLSDLAAKIEAAAA